MSLLTLTGCAAFQPPDDWTARDTGLEVGFQIANAYDAHQTQRIRDIPSVTEGGFAQYALGENPDPNETAVYFATVGFSHYLISRLLPPKWRKYWHSGSTAIWIANVERNCDLGLCE